MIAPSSEAHDRPGSGLFGTIAGRHPWNRDRSRSGSPPRRLAPRWKKSGPGRPPSVSAAALETPLAHYDAGHFFWLRFDPNGGL